MLQIPARQILGVYYRRIGHIAVTALSDGDLDSTFDVLEDSAPAESLTWS